MATPRKTSSSAPAKKAAPQKKAAARKTTPRKRASSASQDGSGPAQDESGPVAQGSEGHKRLPLRQVVLRAAGELQDLVGREPESIVGVERMDGEWKVQIEVVESRRIPDTTSILAVYEVVADDNGRMMSYHRSDRYMRGRFEE